MSILVTGGTGFVGQKVLSRLKSKPTSNRSHTFTCSRNPDRAKDQLGSLVSKIIPWNPISGPLDLSSLPEYDSLGEVVNLMGEPIAEGRWTADKMQRIRDSRVLGTRNLIQGILDSQRLPSVFVSASAVGIYGDCGESLVDESHSRGAGFLADVCQEWEDETRRLSDLGVRVINFRIGIVLGTDGGALAQLIPLFRWGLGGRLGNGKQFFPWIHVEDLIRMIVWCLESPTVDGPVNATAPEPVRNHEFTQALARALSRPAFLPVPQFAARLALGQFANSLFDSQRVVPEVALKNGFNFQFPELAAALEDLT